MKHKANILLLGFTYSLSIESLPGINFSKCNSLDELTELLLSNEYKLIISKFKLGDKTALDLNETLESLKTYFADSTANSFKLLVLTSTEEEDNICKVNKLLYFPEEMNLKSLILKLIDLPREPKKTDKDLAIIDFNELFIRVDNNRAFIKEVIEKFFSIKESRISEILVPLENGDYKKAKDSAHKLKGVLANFSMLEAKATIIELEQIILSEDLVKSLNKLKELNDKIDLAKEFYLSNQDQFETT
ncbi:Hpt domain-containing protein [Marinifilum flexuosum]|uniref:HPt (Histidine-containing phosphotransfer) domain-containing protein n=1 Tax=Marinifilum flexuosum TaxID=1117708 RepID=A0A419X444_9BACT|nr:Hpt domain-containing protein [Marinifilum flexuosum]RKE02514.1 HPt (histidine-containing phosphotransfer) domain-containing protein [Marinifilum flexuosum]